MAERMKSTLACLCMVEGQQRERFAERRAEAEAHAPDSPYRGVLHAKMRAILESSVALRKRIEGMEDNIRHLEMARLLHTSRCA